jgi:protein SCO1/2
VAAVHDSPLSARRIGHALAAAGAVALALAGCGGKSTGAQQSGALASLGRLPDGLAGHPAPRMRLADAHGGRLDTASLRGRPYLVTFLYTHCRDVCPLIGEELRQTLTQLGARASRVSVVAVTVDPTGDTPAAVRRWLRLHHEPANFHYLIGSRKRMTPIWRAWFTAPQAANTASSTHTAAVWVIDKRGRLVADVPAGAPIDPSTLARALQELLQQ